MSSRACPKEIEIADNMIAPPTPIGQLPSHDLRGCRAWCPCMPRSSKGKKDVKYEEVSYQRLSNSNNPSGKEVDPQRMITFRMGGTDFRERLDAFLKEIYDPMVLQLNMLLHTTTKTGKFSTVLLLLEDLTQSYRWCSTRVYAGMKAPDIADKVNNFLVF